METVYGRCNGLRQVLTVRAHAAAERSVRCRWPKDQGTDSRGDGERTADEKGHLPADEGDQPSGDKASEHPAPHLLGVQQRVVDRGTSFIIVVADDAREQRVLRARKEGRDEDSDNEADVQPDGPNHTTEYRLIPQSVNETAIARLRSIRSEKSPSTSRPSPPAIGRPVAETVTTASVSAKFWANETIFAVSISPAALTLMNIAYTSQNCHVESICRASNSETTVTGDPPSEAVSS